MDQSLLVAGKYQPDVLCLIQFVKQIRNGTAGIPENRIHPFLFQCLYE